MTGTPKTRAEEAVCMLRRQLFVGPEDAGIPPESWAPVQQPDWHMIAAIISDVINEIRTRRPVS